MHFKCGTGITQIDLTILEEHVVYSLSKEKEAAYFYIMQSTQSVDDAIQVPIKDVIDRFTSQIALFLLYFKFVIDGNSGVTHVIL